jgi:hypothetical protein
MKIVLTAACLSILAVAASGEDRAKLAGSWESNGKVWMIEDKGASIHITRSEGSRKVSEVECNVAGRECEGKDSGHKTIVTMWFNGGTLVQMETKGPEVVKRRFAISEQGDTLELQTVFITPSGPDETVQFKRVATAVSSR